MFLELADHLRCPVEHDEQYLVLLPDAVERRWVRAGTLGCPVCGREWRIADGVWTFGDAEPAGGDDEAGAPDAGAFEAPDAAPDAEALAALAGVNGPGGYMALVGEPGGAWRALAEVVREVAMVAVNPPAGTADEPVVSVLRGPRIPLKRRSMRGVVLGPGYGGSERWVAEAARVTLPGLRVVGRGREPGVAGLELLASAGGWWVARRTS